MSAVVGMKRTVAALPPPKSDGRTVPWASMRHSALHCA